MKLDATKASAIFILQLPRKFRPVNRDVVLFQTARKLSEKTGGGRRRRMFVPWKQRGGGCVWLSDGGHLEVAKQEKLQPSEPTYYQFIMGGN